MSCAGTGSKIKPSISQQSDNYSNLYFVRQGGYVAGGILAKIDVIIQNETQNDVNLFVRRSFSQHLFSWMNDSASRL